MSIHQVLYLVAVVFFVLAGLSVPKARWEWLAFAALALSLLV